MKKLLLAASVAAAVSLVNTVSAATNGTVTFSGKLNDQTCQVVLNNGSASGTVTLPTVPKEKLSSKYNMAGKTAFTLKLTGCKASTTSFGVLAYFPATAYIENISTSLGFLKNIETGTTAADGVMLTIYKKNGTSEKQINLGKAITDASYQYTTVAANATSATLEYNVRYVNYRPGSSSPVTAGKVRGIAVYELAYQ